MVRTGVKSKEFGFRLSVEKEAQRPQTENSVVVPSNHECHNREEVLELRDRPLLSSS